MEVSGPVHPMGAGPGLGLAAIASCCQSVCHALLREAVPTPASSAQAAARGLGKFGELCWEAAMAGTVGRLERFWALLLASWGSTVEPLTLSHLCFCLETENHSLRV